MIVIDQQACRALCSTIPSCGGYSFSITSQRSKDEDQKCYLYSLIVNGDRLYGSNPGYISAIRVDHDDGWGCNGFISLQGSSVAATFGNNYSNTAVESLC